MAEIEMTETDVTPRKRPLGGLRRWLLALAVAAVAALALIVVAGSLRYGSPQGLWQRLQAEVASRRPAAHPALVPTPLPTPTGLAALAPPTRTPTRTPSPTATALPPTATAEATPTRADPAASSSLPSPTPTVAPSPTPSPRVDESPRPRAPASVALSGFNHFWQTWNNCGPATLAMNLSYFGSDLSQAQVARVLKPDSDDKNVNPAEMAAFARSQGLNALVRVNGDPERLRLLLSNGIPVLIETWLDHDGGMGHYRLLTGYDDGAGQWIAYDSYISEGIDPGKPYPGIRIPYDELARLWRVFNRTYIVIFGDDMAPAVFDILGEDRDDEAMWQRSLASAEGEVAERTEDPFAWFNLGSSLVAVGRFDEAAAAYDRARVIGLPWRMLWYQFGPFLAYHESGRFQELAALADATIATAGNIEETYYWKGRALQAMGDLEGARAAFERAVELNANYEAAAETLRTMNDEG